MAKQDITQVSGPTRYRAGDEQVEIARAGGKASGEARRRKRLLKESLEIALQMVMKKNGKQAVHPVTGEPIDAFDAGMVKLAERFANGEPKAIETVAKLLGQWVDKQEHTHEGDVTIKLVKTGYTPASSEEEILKREGMDGLV
jgi:hypothetical protein